MVIEWFQKKLKLRNEEQLVRQDTGSRSYYTLLAIAAFIATLGILIDNATVVIGAMLIAPLMVPIMSLSVGIARGESETILNSMVNISMSILAVVILAAITGLLVPVVELPQQALVRAQPNVVDLLIAIASGTIGMYAFLHKDVPESLAGVAISVSLVPPLTVIGVGMAKGAPLVALGATVLFFTNVVAILGAAVVVLFLHGRSAQQVGTEEQRDVALASSGVTIAIAIILAVLLSGAFLQVYREESRRATVRETLEEALVDVDGKVTELEITTAGEQVTVEAIIRVPEDVERLDVEQINKALVYALEQSVDLELSLVRVQSATRQLEEGEQEQIQDIKERTQTESLSELESNNGTESAELGELLDGTASGELDLEEDATLRELDFVPESTPDAESNPSAAV